MNLSGPQPPVEPKEQPEIPDDVWKQAEADVRLEFEPTVYEITGRALEIMEERKRRAEAEHESDRENQYRDGDL